MADLFGPIFIIVHYVIQAYIWCIIIFAILSWLIAFNVVNTRNPLVHTVGDFLYRITEPALRPIRRIIPLVSGIDLSPIVLILVLWLIDMYVLTIFGRLR